MNERQRPAVLGAIALGGALGTAARYGVAQLFPTRPGSFPWSTLWTNLSGSFALGVVVAIVLQRFPPSRYVRPFVAVGFLGAYTTYSTFVAETVVLVRDGEALVAVIYAALSLIAGLLLAWAGIWSVRLRAGG
ncbi:MAG TPA: fluoride efflux transporter CrcB [Acidimicrobiales bacterium]|nr:fluoride efflux transporter CrcB [Acidimicrobiales bacterium]